MDAQLSQRRTVKTEFELDDISRRHNQSDRQYDICEDKYEFIHFYGILL
jgi:hypothetical protein